MPRRQIVRIDQQLCNGCGACITPCAESAIVLGPDGKAHVIDDTLCDGAGFCLGICPTGALTIETREAPAFNAHAAEERQGQRGPQYIAQKCHRCGASEDQAVLLPCRTNGQSLWVCTRCLPALIHD